MPASLANETSGRGLSRRGLLLGSGLAAVGAALGLAGCTPRQAAFPALGTAPLPVPPLAPSRLSGNRRSFLLTAGTGESRLIAGRPEVVTPTMGYNGASLGPTLRARQGELVRVEVRNDLAETTTLHWHGMHLPAAMDGGPHTPIAAGRTRTAEWQLRQPAATLWYHPHPHGQTEAQVLNGLAGLFIVDDDASLRSGLPSEYGVDDLPLILQDRFLDATGRIVRVEGDNALGTIGGTLLANGVSGTHVEVTAALLRLRLLNGCSGRFLDLRFADGRPFTLVGTDGGLLGDPVELDRLLLSPGERAEILVRFRPGDRTVLRTERPELPGTAVGGADLTPGDFVEFRAAGSLRPSAPWRLPTERRTVPSAAQAARTRSFELRMPFINGRPMDLNRIDAVVRLGDTEVWEVTSSDVMAHNFHVHDVQFRVLDIDGAAPPAELAGWKDTVPVLPGQRLRLIMRFEDYADDRVPYMVHCHLLRHEDAGMMGQFLVTADGTGPERIDSPHDHDGHG